MKMTRILVAASALMFAGFGLNGLFHPEALLEMIHVEARDLTALNEARAMYGGFELGVAAFLVACLMNRFSLRAGLFLATAIFTSAAAARGKSVMIEGLPDPLFVKIWMFELVFAAICLVTMANDRNE